MTNHSGNMEPLAFFHSPRFHIPLIIAENLVPIVTGKSPFYPLILRYDSKPIVREGMGFIVMERSEDHTHAKFIAAINGYITPILIATDDRQFRDWDRNPDLFALEAVFLALP